MGHSNLDSITKYVLAWLTPVSWVGKETQLFPSAKTSTGCPQIQVTIVGLRLHTQLLVCLLMLSTEANGLSGPFYVEADHTAYTAHSR